MNIRKLLTRLVSLALIAVFLPTVAMADTWYLEDGSITVSATDSGQNVSQGGVTKEDSAPSSGTGILPPPPPTVSPSGRTQVQRPTSPWRTPTSTPPAAQGRMAQATRR